MIVDLTKLEGSKIEFDLLIKPKDIKLDVEYAELKSAVKFEGKLVNEEFWSVIDGGIYGKAEVGCSRCLDPIPYELDFEFENAYIKGDDLTEENETELSVQNLEVLIIDDDKIDLNEIVSENISLELNQTMVCKDDCKGLCPKCGANLNRNECECDADTDSRWSALKDIKID